MKNKVMVLWGIVIGLLFISLLLIGSYKSIEKYDFLVESSKTELKSIIKYSKSYQEYKDNYQRSIKEYNNNLKRFPNIIVSKIFNIKEK